MFCSAQRVLTPPGQDETAPSNQSIAAGVLGKAEGGVLQTKAWYDCSCTSSWVSRYPGDAARSPEKIYALIRVSAGGELKMLSLLWAGLCHAVLSNLLWGCLGRHCVGAQQTGQVQGHLSPVM